mgnify:CR=1 FL=1
MSLREEQCKKVCRILDSVLANRPTERDSLIVAVQKAFAEPKRGKWIYCEDSTADSVDGYRCDQCGFFVPWDYTHKSIDYIKDYNFCPKCGSYNGGENDT